jgi:hypothetical protein
VNESESEGVNVNQRSCVVEKKRKKEERRKRWLRRRRRKREKKKRRLVGAEAWLSKSPWLKGTKVCQPL